MHLSKRLQMVVNCVTKGNVVADVGCDHSYISIYLVESEIAPRTVALDINEGPLKRARANIRQHGLEERIQTVLCDGLTGLTPNTADSIVIAGMGGAMMVHILENACEIISNIKEIILQPQSEVEKVREYLHRIGFVITKEDMCMDDNKYYVVMRAQKEQEYSELDAQVFLRFGRCLLEQRHPVLLEFLNKEHNKTCGYLAQMKEKGVNDLAPAVEKVKQDINMLEQGLNYYR